MISNKVMIVCPQCRRNLLTTDVDIMASYTGDDVIIAEDFKSVVDGWKDPQIGDSTNCPYCRSDYGQAIRKVWMEIRGGFLIKEWDE